ncbi:MAG: RpiB/LacA/LacB family sugar-phosphate isomerase [Alphaproteobacteria bacterium]|nr:RpiB/LacA/LacB family sugar-phosphate isomerase [Alphaproteobacteria bacterium]
MKKECVYIIASKDVADQAHDLFIKLACTEVVVKFDLVFVNNLNWVEKHYGKGDSIDISGADVGNMIATLVGDVKHRGILVTGSGGGANIRANAYANVRAYGADSEAHAVDLREKALINTLIWNANFTELSDFIKRAIAFLKAEPSEERKAMIADKNSRRVNLFEKLYGQDDFFPKVRSEWKKSHLSRR